MCVLQCVAFRNCITSRVLFGLAADSIPTANRCRLISGEVTCCRMPVRVSDSMNAAQVKIPYSCRPTIASMNLTSARDGCCSLCRL